MMKSVACAKAASLAERLHPASRAPSTATLGGTRKSGAYAVAPHSRLFFVLVIEDHGSRGVDAQRDCALGHPLRRPFVVVPDHLDAGGVADVGGSRHQGRVHSCSSHGIAHALPARFVLGRRKRGRQISPQLSRKMVQDGVFVLTHVSTPRRFTLAQVRRM